MQNNLGEKLNSINDARIANIHMKKKLSFLPTLYHTTHAHTHKKNYFRMTIDLYMDTKAAKLSEENIKEYCCNLKAGKDSLDRTQEVTAIKEIW